MNESPSKRPSQIPTAEPRRVAQPAPSPAVEKAAALPAPMPEPALPPPEIPAVSGIGPLAFFDAFAHGAEAVADEMAGLTRSGFSTVMETAEAMLGAKTLDEAVAIHAGFVRKSLDTMLSGSLRLTDIATRLAANAMPSGAR